MNRASIQTPDQTRAAMQEVMGAHPGADRHVPLDIRVEEEVQEPLYTRQRITFASEPGDRVPAWLLLPRPGTVGAPAPAMLCLHQTTRIGKGEPVGLGGKPNLHYARELAERGYIALVPDYPGYGDYAIDPYAMGYASATMKGIWNHGRAVDLLVTLPGVDSRRIGVIGHSLGGHNALFVAAFDERIRVVVSSCGFTRFTRNDDEGRGSLGDVRDWSHRGYMPRIADVYNNRAENLPFDFEHVLAAIAPRPLFINAPRGDFFRCDGVIECVDLVRPLFAATPVPEALAVRHPDGEHDFPTPIRHEAYAWLSTAL